MVVEPGDVVDAAFMSCRHLRAFIQQAIRDAQDEQILLSLHLKATMMKVSDPIIFGHALECFFEPVFERHCETFARAGVNPRNGSSGRLFAA